MLFAILLAAGAAVQLTQITGSARSFVPLAVYACWLAVGVAVASALWLRASRALPAQARRRSFRGVEATALRVEGLGPFAFAAGAGLVVHLINAVGEGGARHQQRGRWLVFFILACCSYYQLRGTGGDADVPIPDGSRIARAGSLLRRALGVLLCCIGVGLLVVALPESGTASDGMRQFLAWTFVAGGILLLLLGLPLALMPRRDRR